MKTAVLVPLTVLASAVAAFAQGPFTPPPGAPAPLMKSLDQIEARTPLVAGQAGVAIDANSTITISQPGSYYLTKNLTITGAGANGINITASHVTLDLNGFSLIHVTGNGGQAVSITAGDVTVRNGSIRGGSTLAGSTFTLAGWNNGIVAATNYPNLVVEGVTVSGVRGCGIYLLYEGSRIERCSVHTVGAVGMHATSVSFSSARKTGHAAIDASYDPDSGSVSDCFAETVSPSAPAIYAPDGVVSNCRGIAVGGIGIEAETVSNSYGTSGAGAGVKATVANSCRGVSTSGIGISGTSIINCHAQSTSGSSAINAYLVTSCVAIRSGGVAIVSHTANGCYISAGTLTTTNKYNMP